MLAGQRLGRYEIVAQLGAGGMGEVYRALDTELEREVAVKVLPEAVSGDPKRLRRFSREARSLSRLSHPNILEIHDVGCDNGVHYVVTELLEGETLRKRISDGGLTISRSVELAVQIARGLAAAHDKGIVHRDLKPDNVFVTTDGTVKLLDFGLAELIVPEHAGSATTATAFVAGTVGYMAPEQLRAQEVTLASDIFAFGCVLYEMLSGRRAFAGETPAETISAILSADPLPVSPRERAVPVALERLISRCLEKNAQDRFHSVRDLALALQALSSPQNAPAPALSRWLHGRGRARLAVSGFVVVLTIGAISAWLRSRPAVTLGHEQPGPKRMVVLPFENQGAPEDGYFADGMTDEVRGKLASLSGLTVIARASSDQYKGTTKPLEQIADELSAAYLLTGKVRWQKDDQGRSRVRVTPELVEVTGPGAPTTHWQGSFDGDLHDVFKVQSEIAARVAGAMEVKLGARENRRLAQPPTTSLDAYDAFLRGQEISNDLFRFQPRTLRAAITQYERAVALDPGFALAWAKLSRAYTLLFVSDVPSPAVAESAREAAERAVQTAAELPEARLARGYVYYSIDQDVARAQEEYSAGLAIDPRDAQLLARQALAEASQGRWGQALAGLRQACSVDPRSVYSRWFLGRVLLYLRRYPEAHAALDRALALDPENTVAVIDKANLLLAQRDLAGARSVVATSAREVDPAVFSMYSRGRFGWLLDETQQRRVLGLTPADFDNNRAVWARVLADFHALRGDMTQARRYAEWACEAYAGKIAASPDSARLHAYLGVTLAYLARRREATREAEQALRLITARRDAYGGPRIQIIVVYIYIILGDYEQAVDMLEALLKVPCNLSTGLLSLDPHYTPLRGNPRFEKLLEAESGPR